MKNVRKWKMMLLAGSAAAVMLLGGCGKTENQDEKTETEAMDTEEVNTEKTGETASAAEGLFAGMDTVDLDGKKADASVFAENKLTLVNLWSTSCSPCIMEIPELERLSQDFADRGVAVKGLLYDFGAGVSEGTQEEAEEILSKAGATYQQLTLSAEMFRTEEIQKLEGFPTTYFVDSSGQIVDQILGANNYEGWKEVIEAKLEAMPSEPQK